MAEPQQQQAGAPGGGELCLACHRTQIEYECLPCRHKTLCKPCAMKQATGGRCKVCRDLFTELRRKREGDDGSDDDDDNEGAEQNER